jgi:tellurite resistance protein TehA-like permease
MTKDDFFDLIVKAFGVFFLVLAIMQIPSVITGAFVLLSVFGMNFPDDTDKTQVTLFIASFGGIFKFFIYILASVNFLRSGSLVKKIMGKRNQPASDELKP